MDGLRGDEDHDLPIFRPRTGGGRRPQLRSQAGSLRNAVLACLRRGPARFGRGRACPGSGLAVRVNEIETASDGV
jgi:hypothetical protein